MMGAWAADNRRTLPNPGWLWRMRGDMGLMRWVRLGGIGVCAAGALVAQPADQAAFLNKARQAYYSQSKERMDKFQCQLVPNWKLMLEEQKLAPEIVAAAVGKLGGIRFTLTLDRKGVSTITHSTVSAENDQVADGLKQVYSGMEQMTTGFFQTWSIFMVNPPLPEPKVPFRLEELGAWHILRYEEGASSIETTLGKDLAVSAMKIVDKAFHCTISPTFAKTAKGLVLVGYQASYRSTSAGEATDLNVTLVNQELNGLVVPKKMDLRGTYGSTPFHVEVAFVEGQASTY